MLIQELEILLCGQPLIKESVQTQEAPAQIGQAQPVIEAPVQTTPVVTPIQAPVPPIQSVPVAPIAPITPTTNG